jgi:hypothetical protein
MPLKKASMSVDRRKDKESGEAYNSPAELEGP